MRKYEAKLPEEFEWQVGKTAEQITTQFPEFWLDINYYIGSIKSYAEFRYVLNSIEEFFNSEEEALDYVLNTLYYRAKDETITFMYSFPAERDASTLREWCKANLSVAELEKIGVIL